MNKIESRNPEFNSGFDNRHKGIPELGAPIRPGVQGYVSLSDHPSGGQFGCVVVQGGRAGKSRTRKSSALLAFVRSIARLRASYLVFGVKI